MPFEFRSLDDIRYMVWDLMRETDQFYLNHHLFDVDFSAVETAPGRRLVGDAVYPSVLAYSLRAYARSFAEFPELNSYLRIWPTVKLAVYRDVDIALTVERQWSGRPMVMIAVLREAQKLTVEGIHEFLVRLRETPIERLEEFRTARKLARIPRFLRWHLFQIFAKPFPEFMRGFFGTTAFTSVGKFGTTLTTPLSPRSVTLSLGKVEIRPRFKEGRIQAAPSAWMTVTYDHRIADGAQIARFGDSIRRRLETLDLD